MKQDKHNKGWDILLTLVMGIACLGLSLACWFKPSDEISETERRQLAQFPTINKEQILSGTFMSEFEAYTLDQFPLRDSFRSVKAMANLFVLRQKDNNGYYVSGNSVAKQDYPLNHSSMERACSVFSRLYEQTMAGTDAKVYFSIIPDKNYVLAKEAGQLSYDYGELVDYMKKNLSQMSYIDVFPYLSRDDYYDTDPHWRQECITDVADALLQGMDTPKSEVEYKVETLDAPFRGTYYGQLGLRLEPDKINYLTADFFEDCEIFDWQNNKAITMYDMEKAKDKDPYEMYLSGPLSLITIDNPHAKTDKELVVFRDSFTSSLAPLLTDSYKKITLLDIRYLQSAFVGGYVQFDKQDVLFLYSSAVLNHSETLK